MPGVIETLDALEAKRRENGGGNEQVRRRSPRSILTQLDMADRFVTIIGGDTMGKGNAKPKPDSVIEARRLCGAENAPFAFVGDSTYDVNAAKAAGVPVIAAAYGYCDMPPRELGADAVIERFDQLLPALEAL